VLDFFCGAGGFSEGFRQAGYEIVEGYDNWEPACKTFRHNQNANARKVDILELTRSFREILKLPDTDIIIGSPPCISFSSSNKSGKAHKASGMKLIRAYLRIIAVKKHQPNSSLKAWLMENVPNSSKYLRTVYSFKDLGLTSFAKSIGKDAKTEAIRINTNNGLLDAANFGTPQARKRFFCGELIGSLVFPVPSPTHGPGTANPFRTLGGIRKSLPSPLGPNGKKVKDPLYPGLKIAERALTDHYYDTGVYRTEWEYARYLKTNHPYMGPMSFPEAENRPSRTILATRAATTRESIIYRSELGRVGDGEYRVPTVRECATLMGFPIDYQYCASEATKWRLVGNAVCPPVSFALAKAIMGAKGCAVSEPRIERVLNVHSFPVESVPSTFKPKDFTTQSNRRPNSRFRRHPFKEGNMTVALMNYHPEQEGQVADKWHTAIYTGTHDFGVSVLAHDEHKRLKSEILHFYGEEGGRFLDAFETEIERRLPATAQLQGLYTSHAAAFGPIEIVDAVAALVKRFDSAKPFVQNGYRVIDKDVIPMSQLFTMFAMSKIVSK